MPAAGDKGGDNRIAEGGMLKVYRKSREDAILESRRRGLGGGGGLACAKERLR